MRSGAQLSRIAPRESDLPYLSSSVLPTSISHFLLFFSSPSTLNCPGGETQANHSQPPQPISLPAPVTVNLQSDSQWLSAVPRAAESSSLWVQDNYDIDEYGLHDFSEWFTSHGNYDASSASASASASDSWTPASLVETDGDGRAPGERQKTVPVPGVPEHSSTPASRCVHRTVVVEDSRKSSQAALPAPSGHCSE